MKKRISILLILVSVFGLIPVNFSLAITQNQINAEVQIVCPDNYGNWFSGSGTIIDSKGIILTNKHVVTDEYGGIIETCFIGFMESISQEPDFGTSVNRYLAEVKYYTTTDDMDAAILYLDNPSNKSYQYINIWNSDSSTLQFGNKIEVIGFPSIGGSTITYTSGDFSGFGSSSDGTQNYIKTTAWLGHGNSGGAAYNTQGLFIGIPTMSITVNGDSMNYLLSINSIKNWLSGILGSTYKQEIIQNEPSITKPTSLNIQNDITPPNLKQFTLNLLNVDENGNVIHSASVGESVPVSIYEFPRVKFEWYENCSDVYCINDNGSYVTGYYYYFGNNISADPIRDGKYISSENLINGEFNNEVVLPEIFVAQKNISNYFILKAKDTNNNISDNLFIFEYVYEPDRYKDIKDIIVKDYNNKLIGNIQYPNKNEINICNIVNCNDGSDFDYIIKEIYTNQNTLYFYPEYKENINGLVYYVSYGDDIFWHDKFREGAATSDNFFKISNISKNKEINIFIKPGKESVNSFLGKHYILKIRYKGDLDNKVRVVNKQEYFEIDRIKYKNIYGSTTFENSGINNWGELKFSPIDSDMVEKLKGKILLQIESYGEAWYVNPSDGKRYYMKDGTTAYQMMRNFGLGVSNADLAKIPQEGEKNNYPSFVSKLKGKILLQVEEHGEAWYVNPKTGYRHYMKDGEAAYNLMRYYSLGITNNDLNKIPEGDL